MHLFRHIFGEGDPLIILHGLFGISDNWVTTGRALENNFRVIIPDLRNHGRSPHSAAFSYDAMCDDILELAEEEGNENFILFGHSMGGKLAMNLAVNHPGKIKKLIVADISPGETHVRATHLKILAAMKSLDFNSCKSRNEAEIEIARFLPDRSIRLFVMKNLVRVAPGRFAWRINLDAIEKNIDLIMERVPDNHPFTGPALFIRGGNSDYITESDISLIKRIFPASCIETIPGAGHWLHAEQPDMFLQVISRWFMI